MQIQVQFNWNFQFAQLALPEMLILIVKLLNLQL